MNIIDKAVAYINPQAAITRAEARRKLQILNDYDVLKQSRQRSFGRSISTPDELSARSHLPLSQMARHLVQNYDLAFSVLDTMVNNVIGPKGIQVEPMPLKKDGSIDTDVANQIKAHLHNYNRCADIHFNQKPEMQRLIFRAMLLDGEVFVHTIKGKVNGMEYRNDLYFTQELILSQYCPDFTDDRLGILSGIKRNSFGQVVSYGFTKARNAKSFTQDIEFKSSKDILHVKLANDIGQIRGTTIFAPVFARMQDLKDYENAEQLAAKMAACMVASIVKNAPDGFNADSLDDPKLMKKLADRKYNFTPGQVWELEPGEDINVIESSRPSPQGVPYIKQMGKAIAAGTGSSYSTFSRNYDGNYSAQRQELLDVWVNYSVLQNRYIESHAQPTHISLISHLYDTKKIIINKDTDLNMLDNAAYIAQVMPWIDPAKEINACETALRMRVASRTGVIMARGDSPDDINNQILNDQEFTRNLDPLDLPTSTKKDGSYDPEGLKLQQRDE